MSDTIAAIATAPGPSAIGVVRLSGPGTRSALDRVFRPKNGRPMSRQEPRRLVLGDVLDREGRVIDSALAVLFPGPGSYTGQDCGELQCHGSPVVLDAALDALFAAGARQAQGGEFTRRAFLNGRMDLLQAEAVADLIDAESPAAARNAADACPLGAAALAGTTYPLDRFATAEALGFDHPIPNSLDAVSDRDFLLDLIYACSVSCLHLSRLCEEIVLWSSAEFGFITLSDAYSTGSSIMPQKKNPDFAELIRGKSGRVVGDLVALMMTLKSLPLAYNKDLQEDKEGAMDAADTLEDCYVCAAGMIATMTVNADAMATQAKKGYLAATDVADYLAKKGLPFRRAHEIVGHLVLTCEQRGCDLEDLTLDDFKAESDLFESDIVECLNLPAIVAARTTFGGTAPEAVRVQLAAAKAQLVGFGA